MKHCLPRNARVILLLAALGLASYVKADTGPVITDSYAAVNGVKLHYLVAGNGDPVISLPWLRAEQPLCYCTAS